MNPPLDSGPPKRMAPADNPSFRNGLERKVSRKVAQNVDNPKFSTGIDKLLARVSIRLTAKQLLLGLGLLLWVINGCGGPEGPPAEILRLNMATPPTSLDPAFARNESSIRVVQQLYSGLVRLDAALQPEPDLATRWTVADSGRAYTFYLRPNVRFQPDGCWPGSPPVLTAHDVLYSLHRLLDPRTASPGAWIFQDNLLGVNAYREGHSSTISGLEAPTDSTVVFHLKRPQPSFLTLLAMPYAYVVPKAAVQHYGSAFGEHPVGTGPFFLKRWVPGQHLTLRRNQSYYTASYPKLAGVFIRFIANKLTAYAALQRGDLDALDNLDPRLLPDLFESDGELRARWQGKLVPHRGPQLTVEYLGLMTDPSLRPEHPLRDPRIRRALRASIDRTALCRYLLHGQGVPARHGLVPDGLPGYPAANQPFAPDSAYQPEVAKALLTEAGYPGGNGLPAIKLVSNPNYRHLSDFLQRSAEAVGIRLVIEDYEGSTLRTMRDQGELDCWRASWIADYPDAENFLSLLYGPNTAPDGPNAMRYQNPEVDALLQQAQREPQDSLRIQLFRRAQALAAADAPVIPLFYYQSVWLWHPRVSGLVPSASPLVLDLRTVTVAAR